MSEQMQDLARRAVACKHWRWMPGMAIDGLRVTHVNENKNASACGDYSGARTWEVCEGSVPDLTDAATIGCVLALVREAWRNPSICPMHAHPFTNQDWVVAVGKRCFHGVSEVEALVEALERAP